MEYIKTNQKYILKAGIELCSEILAVTLIFIQLLKIFTKYEQLYNFNFCPWKSRCRDKVSNFGNSVSYMGKNRIGPS